MKPVYAENLVVAIKHASCFEWYVLEKDFSEPESYENFVPNGWIGKYEDFTDDIPENQRYWLDKNGRCLIGE